MSRADHVLIVDDDAELRRLLSGFLERYGFRATAVGDGKAARDVLATRQIDIIVLDLMLPGEDGVSICRDIRTGVQAPRCPIIMLTARGEPVDRVVGLEVGADDYMAKPFDPRELLARIRSVMRRSRMPPQSSSVSVIRELRFAGWVVNYADHSLATEDGGTRYSLTDSEFRLLQLLAENAHRVMSRDDIMELMVGRQALPFDRRIDVQVCRLRSLLHDSGRDPRLIRTVRNRGYEFCADVECR